MNELHLKGFYKAIIFIYSFDIIFLFMWLIFPLESIIGFIIFKIICILFMCWKLLEKGRQPIHVDSSGKRLDLTPVTKQEVVDIIKDEIKGLKKTFT